MLTCPNITPQPSRRGYWTNSNIALCHQVELTYLSLSHLPNSNQHLNLRFTNRHGGRYPPLFSLHPHPHPSPPFSLREFPPMRGLHPSDELETRRDFAEKSTRPQVPGGHSPLLPNPSCSSSSSSSVLKSPLARISIDQPQEEKGNQDPRNALYQEQTSRRSESNSVRGGVCALDWEGARDRRRPTGPVIVAPIPHPKDPRCWKEGGRGGGRAYRLPLQSQNCRLHSALTGSSSVEGSERGQSGDVGDASASPSRRRNRRRLSCLLLHR